MVLNNLIITDFVYGEKPGLIYRGIIKRGRSIKKRKSAEGYNPEVELAKGANLTAAFYDKTQKLRLLPARSLSGRLGTVLNNLIIRGGVGDVVERLNVWDMASREIAFAAVDERRN